MLKAAKKKAIHTFLNLIGKKLIQIEELEKYYYSTLNWPI